MFKIESYTAAVLINLGIMSLIAFAVWYLDSGYPLWGLLAMASVKASKLDTECPQCGHEFTAIKEQNEVV